MFEYKQVQKIQCRACVVTSAIVVFYQVRKGGHTVQLVPASQKRPEGQEGVTQMFIPQSRRQEKKGLKSYAPVVCSLFPRVWSYNK